MPRARSASAIRGSSEGGNGARTGGRGAKWRVAVMHGPVVGEVSRSSRIRPSIGPTLSRPADPPRRLLQDRRVRLRVEADQPRAPWAGMIADDARDPLAAAPRVDGRGAGPLGGGGEPRAGPPPPPPPPAPAPPPPPPP